MATSQVKSLFEDYEGFVEKFKPKKTTDDCYTHPEVYDVVLDFVDKEVEPIAGRRVMRPFYPGGDYQAEDYTGAVVVDNPPFSILKQIVDWYCRKDIKFYLFCNHLTAFGLLRGQDRVKIILADTAVVYANGAEVGTSFVTNMGDLSIIVEVRGDLRRKLKEVQKTIAGKKQCRKVVYPDAIVSAALMGKFCVLDR